MVAVLGYNHISWYNKNRTEKNRIEMSDEEFNEWETSSGLPLDGATIEVTDTEWGPNNNIGPGRLFGNFTFSNLDSGEDVEQSFSVGNKWKTDREGRWLLPENENQRNLQINDNTTYGILLTSAVECIGERAGATTRAEKLKAAGRELGGSPRDIHVWLGTFWEMGTMMVESTNPQTGETKEVARLIFTEYLGRGDDEDDDGDSDDDEEEEEQEEKEEEQQSQKSKGTKKETKKSQANTGKTKSEEKSQSLKPSTRSQKSSSNTAKGQKSSGKQTKKGSSGSGQSMAGPPKGVDAELWSRLINHAKEVMQRDEDNDHETFVDEVLEWSDVEDDKTVQKHVMVTKEGSVWAAAKK